MSHTPSPWCTSLNSLIRLSHLSGGSTMFLLSVVGGRSWGSGFLLLFATFTGPVAIAEVFVTEVLAFLPILLVLLFLALLWKATPLLCKCSLPICLKVTFAVPRVLFIVRPAILLVNSLALYLSFKRSISPVLDTDCVSLFYANPRIARTSVISDHSKSASLCILLCWTCVHHPSMLYVTLEVS